MAYDPADLRLPPWLIRGLDLLVELRLPLFAGWQLGITRPGAVMLASVLGVWAAALYSANNLLYLCGSMLLMIAAGGLIQGVQVLRQLPDFHPAMPDWLEAGSPLILRKDTAATGSIAAEVLVEGEGWRLQWWHGSGHAHLAGRLLAHQRGLLHTRHLRCSTAAPIGMWQLSRRVATDMILPVLPKIVVLPAQTSASPLPAASRQWQDGDDFHDLRAYVNGDALARIHWRKAGEDHRQWRVKRFAQPQAVQMADSLTVDLRLPAQMGNADFERLLGMAWFWLKSRWQQHQPVESVTIGQQHFAATDTEWQRACLLALASARPEASPPSRAHGKVLSLMS